MARDVFLQSRTVITSRLDQAKDGSTGVKNKKQKNQYLEVIYRFLVICVKNIQKRKKIHYSELILSYS